MMNPDLLRFMSAHVAMHAREGASITLWPARQIVDVFNLLPPPSIDFGMWANRVNAMTNTGPDDSERSAALNGAGVAMVESATDLQRDGVVSIEDA